jgi:hypothetical protein
MKNQKHKKLLIILTIIFVISGLQIVFATVPNPGHLLSELECNSLFCINSTAGTVTIGGTASIPLIVNGRITSTGTPTVDTDVATKGYVDGLIGSSGSKNVLEITSSSQWTVPAGVEFIDIILIGGGGGGGNGSATDSGAGGGSGFIDNSHLTVTPGEILNVIVGAGGDSSLSGGSSYLTKADGKLLAWANGGGAGNDAGSLYGGGPGMGRCNGGSGQDYCMGCPSCTGQCGGGMCGMTSANSGGYGGTGYGAGGGGGGAGESGHRAGGGAGGYYGAVSVPVSANNGSGQTGGSGAPGIVIIAY